MLPVLATIQERGYPRCLDDLRISFYGWPGLEYRSEFVVRAQGIASLQNRCAHIYARPKCIHPPSPGFLLPGNVLIARKEDRAPAIRFPTRYRVADSAWGESEIEEEDGLSSCKMSGSPL